jgi:peptidoglycan/xylan/chitin deacetylase (PgdA/CDA1 family)
VERLRAALDRIAQGGGRARFWLRDDDVTGPSGALDRLLALGVPVVLAAIPAGAGEALADRLSAAPPGVRVAVHGWAHANHAGPGEKKQELGAHRPVAVVAEDLARGRGRLAALVGPRLLPLMVPPWNRIAPGVVAALPALGFRALSVSGPPRPAPLAVINPQVDIMDWRGTRGGKPAAQVEAAVVAALEAGGPVGLLTHHLAHDRGAWRALAAVVATTAAHPACAWVGVETLLP